MKFTDGFNFGMGFIVALILSTIIIGGIAFIIMHI